MALIQTGSDNFNRADETLTGWTVTGGTNTFTVSSNKLAWGTAEKYATQDIGNAAHYIQAAIQNVGNNIGMPLAVRFVDGSNYVGVRINGGNYQMYKNVAGFTQVGSNVSAASAAIGDIWRLEADGDTITFYVNDVSVISGTVADNNTATKVGTVNRAGVINPILDDAVWGYIGTAGGMPRLISGNLTGGGLIGGRLVR